MSRPLPAGRVRHGRTPHASLRTRLRRMLIAGLIILAPVALTVAVLVFVFRLMDGIFAPIVDRALGVHVPGLGLLLTLLVVLVLGWLSTNVAGRRVIHAGEKVIDRIPIAKSVYGATKGVLVALSQDQTEAFKRVVLVEYPKADLFALGFVTTSARWGQVDARLADSLMVFVPTSPNPTSGYLLVVPRREVVELPITVEEGIRMVISGGILLPEVPAAAAGGPPPSPEVRDALG